MPPESGAAAGIPPAAAPAPLPSRPRVCCMDEHCFEHFAPLVRASQEYASHSGCRFRSSSFDGLLVDGAAAGPEADCRSSLCGLQAEEDNPYVMAKLRAAPEVGRFRSRLTREPTPPELLQELSEAFRIVMAESLRNAMMGMFQALGMFPPRPRPIGVADDDCEYQDLSVTLPVMAQRLYNDQAKRMIVDGTDANANMAKRQTMTAAFIVDFASGAGLSLPAVPEDHQLILRELSRRVSEAAASSGHAQADSARISAEDGTMDSALANGGAVDLQQSEASGSTWQENARTVAWFAGLATVVSAMGAAVLSRPWKKPEDHQSERSGEL